MIGRHMIAAGAVAAGALAAASSADAETTLVGLTGQRTLVFIDADNAQVLRRATVSGINAGLAGIDVRPLDGQLYGVVRDGTVVVINTDDGSATVKSMLTQTIPAGVRATIDFNPAADRLRMIGADGTNLRANVDTGMVTPDTDISFAANNPFGGITPRVIAAAYSNSVAGAKATILWDIEDTTEALYVQIPPNDGVLNPVANPLGVSPVVIGFDIETLPTGVNRAWLVNGNTLFQVGLVSGLAQNGRTITGLRGSLRDLAVLPPPPL